ncbi:hypothetical protein PM3016_2792 [Paenibacillus mucilaginosus 3016]|uniref:Uncharacterized protein n=1 Tax=Paenibacillus mucilaginosus 3016 TaxID=1116391 RepID=H6NJI8_9BACL|nr:hypothetical protein [Paenibacillus mucilaginosus]AFC29668.1 hypothetical protein PM3016_2792 [Paenibacillus mucilaginosus 3016]WFA18346.1 hypothetical protein ERY13_14245 [Paenibacillus mucilaginosus]
MIYKDTYHLMMNSLSSTEIDACLAMLLHLDWENRLRTEPEHLARQIGTTSKYMGDILRKFLRDKKVLSKDRKDDTYAFRYGQSSLQYDERTTKYGKKFSLYYTPQFRSLSLNAKRLLIMALFRISETRDTEFHIPRLRLIRRSGQEGRLPLTGTQLLDVLQELRDAQIPGLSSAEIVQFQGEANVVIRFSDDIQQAYLENHTEMNLVKRELFKLGLHRLVPSDELCHALLSVGYHLFKSMLEADFAMNRREGEAEERRQGILRTARHMYNTALARLAASFPAKRMELTNKDKLAAYFSAIVHEVMTQEMASCSYQVLQQESLLDYYMDKTKQEGITYGGPEVKALVLHIDGMKRMAAVLETVCQQWLLSRVATLSKDLSEAARSTQDQERILDRRGWTSIEEGKAQLRKLLKHEEELLAAMRAHVGSGVRVPARVLEEAMERYFVEIQTRAADLAAKNSRMNTDKTA